MKNTKKLFGIIAIIAIIGLTMLACPNEPSGSSGADTTVNISKIPGVVPPSIGQTPKTVISETTQYSGSIKWSPEVNIFEEGEVYTATITLTAKRGYTFEGVNSNFFTVSGATSVSNEADSGIVIAVFPKAAFGVTFDPDNGEDFIFQNIQPGDLAEAPDGVIKRIDSIDINNIKTAGLYNRQLTLLGWYNDETLFDFNTPVNESIFLKAKWSSISDPISSVAGNNITDAVTYIKANPDDYLLMLSADVDCAAQSLNTSDIKLMLAGIGRECKINLSSNGSLFTVGNYSSTGVELTLGNNITLVGRTNGVNGAAANNNNNLVVVQSGASFNMLAGSKITGNTSSSTSTGGDAAVRITGSGSSFSMQGGTITGNTGVNGAADVYIDNSIAVFGFKLSGSAQIGTLILNASTKSSYAYSTIVQGWTGSIGKLNLRGSSSSMDNVKSYWEEKIIIEAYDNYVLSAADLAKINLGDFISSASSDNNVSISDSHYLANSGWLLKNGTGLNVLLSKDGGLPKEYIYLDQVLDLINTSGDYIVTIKSDFELAPRTLNTGDVRITLVGADTEKKISLSQNGVLFTVGAYQKTGIELILGNNITLVGRTEGVNGATANNNNNLVYVRYGASFTMLEGSKVTGNTWNSQSGSSLGASVFVTDSGSSLSMQGGTITGNTGRYGKADVFMAAGTSTLSLSGNARIDSLILNGSDNDRSSVTIVSKWTGSIGELNLAGNTDSVEFTVRYWLYREVIKNAEGYVITSSDLERITLGYFWWPNSSRPIKETHYLYSTGQLFVNEIVHTVMVCINNGRNLAYPDLSTALRYFGSGENIVTIEADQEIESPNRGNDDGLYIELAGANVTFVSADNTEKSIKLINDKGYMFTVYGNDVALTLGNCITLVGYNNYNSGVINVKNGASLTMLSGSKITGNSSEKAAVDIIQSTLTMKGGEISGNKNTYTNDSYIAGVNMFLSKLVMEGGKITGNSNRYDREADLGNGGSEIYLTGTAQIGSMIRTPTDPPITIVSSLINELKLNLYVNGGIPSEAFLNKQIIQPAPGYTLTNADISKIKLNLWMDNSNDNSDKIIDTNVYEISLDGILIKK